MGGATLSKGYEPEKKRRRSPLKWFSRTISLQIYCEVGALTQHTNELLGNGQAKARTTCITTLRMPQPQEGLKHSVELVFGSSRASIEHTDADSIAGCMLNVDLHGAREVGRSCC
ncbi:hypothetical protein M2281_003932 [Mesorhizobium soli]|nr:hypothetical protein [Mesorhizobium soli]